MKKIVLLLASYVLCIESVFSQEIEWQNTIGGNNFDYLYSIQQTIDGGYILGGHSTSNISGDKTENCLGFQDYWVIKLDATGNIQWQNTIGGSNIDYLNSISQTFDGGYICGGWSLSNISSDKTEDSWNNSFDYWVVKLDVWGNIQWQNTIGGNGMDVLYSIFQTADGGYICGGFSNSDISGDKTENNLGAIGLYDYWVVKLDISGNIQWQNTIGGNDNDFLYSISQTSDGGYICGGSSLSNISGDKTEGNLGDYDYWVIKLDASGNIQWQNTIKGIDSEILHSISQTSDGGFICGGLSNSNISGDKTENSLGGDDFWVVKLDSSGNIQWQNTIGGSNIDNLYSITQSTFGGYVCGGYSNSNISGDKTKNNNGGWDFWIVKIDTSGNILWQNTIGGSIGDLPYSVQQTSDGGYILDGHSNSNISGDKIEKCNGQTDYWIVKLTDKHNLITGKLFIDANSNQIQDVSESPVNNNLVYESNTGGLTFSQNTGVYYLNVLDSGNFIVASSLNYYNAVPATHSVYFSGFQQTDSLNDFAFQPAGVFNDLCVTITPLGAFRAGFNASYMINYENVGTTILSPTVIFFPDNDVTFVSANPVANSVTTDSVVWNFGPLAPFQTGSILVTVNVNTGTLIGTLINSGVRIEPLAGDANTTCNYSYWEVLTTGSVDPNAILVDRDTVLTTELTNPPYLEYIIYFQNTGNDTAFNARVLNNLPLELDVATFEFVASSHPMTITYGAHARLMTFTFDNILLPDSIVNEPASHGFVRYRIKPNTTLVAGDSIENTAFIYFDFNAPVQTNTAITEIVLPTGIGEFNVQSLKFNVFPNPARGELIVNCYSLIGNEKVEAKIYDLFGREVFSKYQVSSIKTKEIKLDISKFAKGIYFVLLKTSLNIYSAKFVKQ